VIFNARKIPNFIYDLSLLAAKAIVRVKTRDNYVEGISCLACYSIYWCDVMGKNVWR
jgi:hypothetical protein